MQYEAQELDGLILIREDNDITKQKYYRKEVKSNNIYKLLATF